MPKVHTHKRALAKIPEKLEYAKLYATRSLQHMKALTGHVLSLTEVLVLVV